MQSPNANTETLTNGTLLSFGETADRSTGATTPAGARYMNRIVGPSNILEIEDTLRLVSQGDSTTALSPDMALVYKASVSTTPVAISTLSSNRGGFALVWGQDGSGNRFFDVVAFAGDSSSTKATAIASMSPAGTPVARTYSVSTQQLTLAMASGTYIVRSWNWSGNPF